jgi:hypothetical protein
MAITTTLNRIRAQGPLGLRPPRKGEPRGWIKLLRYLGHTDNYPGDDEPLPYATIVESNGLDDALWFCCAEPQYDHVWREFTLWCAEQVRHLMDDQRSLDALDTVRRYLDGEATEDELAAAKDAADAAADAADDDGIAAADDAIDAADWAAWDPASPDAWADAALYAWAARDKAARAAAARAAALAAAADAAWYAWAAKGKAADAAADRGVAAWGAVEDAQRQKFLELVGGGLT